MLLWQMAQPLQFLVWALPILVLIFLSFVIYIPDFPFNLLSISKLYYLDRCGSSSFVASHLSISPLQNHCRLGHPSIKNLKLLVPSCHQLSHYNVKHVNWVNTKGCLFSLGVRVY